MNATIPDLWGDGITVDVATPLMILRTQETLIAQKTKGIIHGQLTMTTAGNWVQHQLDLIAPAFRDYRVTLLVATHHKDAVYPVYVKSIKVSPGREYRPSAFEMTAAKMMAPAIAQGLAGMLSETVPDGEEADSQDEFIALIRQILGSGDVRALIESLIARSNEIQAPANPRTNGTQKDNNSAS